MEMPERLDRHALADPVTQSCNRNHCQEQCIPWILLSIPTGWWYVAS